MNVRSLRFRMSLWLSLLVSSALALFGATVYVGVKRHLTEQLYASLTKQANSIGEDILSNAAKQGNHYLVVEINETFAPELNGRFIRVTQPDGTVIYQSNNPRDASFSIDQIPPVAAPPLRGYPPRMLDLNGFPLVLQGTLFTDSEGHTFLIETGAPYNLILGELKSIFFAFALGIPVFLAVAIVGGHILVRSSLRPITAISDQAERISSTNISERLPVVNTGDEVERLSHSLNRMVDRLDDAIQHVSRFSADVSHELRTPLTILRGEMEELIGQANHRRETLETIGNAMEEIDRLSRIVDQLLTISRLDAGQAGVERNLLNLGQLAMATAEQMVLLADEKFVSIRYSINPQVIVAGDPLRLKQVLVNLLDNAIKYTPEGGHIELAVGIEGNRARLSVLDDGIGIPEEALPHIFERFYRADKARTRATGGTGLGLSIIKSIVAAHDGTVTIQSAVGGGTEVLVELPADRNSPTTPPDSAKPGLTPATQN